MKGTVQVAPAVRLGGRIQVPGDKSISHRVAILAGLAHGCSEIQGFLKAEDCLHTLEAMHEMGAQYEFLADGRLLVVGCKGVLSEPAAPLDMGNSGTGLRLLAGLVAGYPQTTHFVGDASLSARPMGRIRDPLEEMGATVRLTGDEGTAPVDVKGDTLKAIDYHMPMASAQVKSCVLLAGLRAKGRTLVHEPAPTRDHTEQLMQLFGAPVGVDGDTVSIEGRAGKAPELQGIKVVVPGDISSAAFWLAAAAMRPGVSITVERVGLNPRRAGILNVLERMGAEVVIEPLEQEGEAVGDVTVTGRELHGTVIEGAEIPNVIDELPLIAVLGSMAEGTTEIRDASELRIKECDRLAVMAENLKRCGVVLEERPDGLTIQGASALTPPDAVLDSHGDHRIVMSLCILALVAKCPLTIGPVDCVATSYPEFWDHMEILKEQRESKPSHSM